MAEKILVTIPKGKTLKITRRRTDSSTDVLLTVNKSTEVVTGEPPPPAPVVDVSESRRESSSRSTFW